MKELFLNSEKGQKIGNKINIWYKNLFMKLTKSFVSIKSEFTNFSDILVDDITDFPSLPNLTATLLLSI